MRLFRLEGLDVDLMMIIIYGDILMVLLVVMGGIGVFVLVICVIFFKGEVDIVVYLFKDLLIGCLLGLVIGVVLV